MATVAASVGSGVDNFALSPRFLKPAGQHQAVPSGRAALIGIVAQPFGPPQELEALGYAAGGKCLARESVLFNAGSETAHTISIARDLGLAGRRSLHRFPARARAVRRCPIASAGAPIRP